MSISCTKFYQIKILGQFAADHQAGLIFYLFIFNVSSFAVFISVGVISMKDVQSHSICLEVMPLCTGFLPMPSIRLSKYIAGGTSKTDTHSKVHPFPPGQLYNSTKSMQIHVIATAGEQ